MRILSFPVAKRGLVACLAAASLVFGAAGPAAADLISGAGAGTGFDEADATETTCGVNPLAALVTDYDLEIDHIGTYEGLDDDTGLPVVYEGPSHVSLTALEDFHFSPLGTHDLEADPTCTLPAPVDIFATVTATGADPLPGGSVNCSGEGTYIREGSNVVIEFAGGCTVVGNVVAGTATGPTQHLLEGALEPCILPPPTGNPLCPPDAGSLYEGVYQAEPVPLP